MNERTQIGVAAGKAAIAKLVEQHRKSGQPLVIQRHPNKLEWVVPQDDGSLKVVREEIIPSKENPKS